MQDPGELGVDCGCEDCPACAELCGDGCQMDSKKVSTVAVLTVIHALLVLTVS